MWAAARIEARRSVRSPGRLSMMGTRLSLTPFGYLMLPGIWVGTRLSPGWVPDHPGNSERTDRRSAPSEHDIAAMTRSGFQATLDQGIEGSNPSSPAKPQHIVV